jgi:hypothetical protein
MRVERSFRWPPEGTHRFFPEWADLPARRGPQWESDWNSYLAGGYAEEFGYHLQPGFWTGFPVIAPLPEQSEEFLAEIGALHPGFPECPRPGDRDCDTPVRDGAPRETRPTVQARVASENTGTSEHWRGQFKVIVVRRESGGKPHLRLALTLMARWAEFRIRHRALGGFF